MSEKPPNPPPPAPAAPVVPKEEVLERLRPFLRPEVLRPERAELAFQAVELIVQESYQGPIPQAREMAAYNQIEQGLAGRIMAMAEREQAIGERERDAAIRSKNWIIGTEVYLRVAGQLMAFLALGGLLGLAGYLGFLGMVKTTGAVITATMAIVALFLGYRNVTLRGASKDGKQQSAPQQQANKRKPGKARQRR